MTREEAISWLKMAVPIKAVTQEEFNKFIEAVNMAIKALERGQTGHWIYHRDWDEDGGCPYECSECGMGSDVDYTYCMRCGAKMESEVNA